MREAIIVSLIGLISLQSIYACGPKPYKPKPCTECVITPTWTPVDLGTNKCGYQYEDVSHKNQAWLNNCFGRCKFERRKRHVCTCQHIVRTETGWSEWHLEYTEQGKPLRGKRGEQCYTEKRVMEYSERIITKTEAVAECKKLEILPEKIERRENCV